MGTVSPLGTLGGGMMDIGNAAPEPLSLGDVAELVNGQHRILRFWFHHMLVQDAMGARIDGDTKELIKASLQKLEGCSARLQELVKETDLSGGRPSGVETPLPLDRNSYI